MLLLFFRKVQEALLSVALQSWTGFLLGVRHLRQQIQPKTTRPLRRTQLTFTPDTYQEHRRKRGPGTFDRSICLVYRSFGDEWHIKVAFYGTLQPNWNGSLELSKRQADLQHLCQDIEYSHITLLRDTVTEVVIECKTNDESSRSLPLKQCRPEDEERWYSGLHLGFFVREDLQHVRYPRISSSTSSKALSTLTKIREISMGVHTVHEAGNENVFLYKEIDRPLYTSRDSEVLEQELRNLEMGIEGAVRLIAPIVSQNPYQTTKTASYQTVLRGILLEYHPNGTLREALKQPRDDMPWYQWAVQITSTLDRFHQKKITLMDLKPSNVVLDKNFNAVLIDISGIGGFTREWLSPEMLDVDPLSQDFESRRQNDLFALGRIVQKMVTFVPDPTKRKVLEDISQQATSQSVPRLSLQHILAKLSLAQQ